jgi:nicotinate-nucleotide adenylyltransferase
MSGIAIFGGTFDPIHVGHVRGIIESREILGAPRVMFIPTGNPPHKQGGSLSEGRHRIEMVSLVRDELGFGELNSFEVDRDDPSYTVHTVSHIKKKWVETPVTVIMGSDSLLEISSWYRYEELLSEAHIAVLPRPGFLTDRYVEEIKEAIKPLEIVSFENGNPSPKCDSILTDRGTRIYLLKIHRLNISSTNIRKKVGRGESIKFLVTNKVEKYIIENKLYQEV